MLMNWSRFFARQKENPQSVRCHRDPVSHGTVLLSTCVFPLGSATGGCGKVLDATAGRLQTQPQPLANYPRDHDLDVVAGVPVAVVVEAAGLLEHAGQLD